MPKPLSVDLRARALALYDEGHPTAEVAARLRVSPAWARRMRQRRREGKPLAAAVGPGRRPLLDGAARATLYGWVKDRPDATIDELRARCRDELGIPISVGAMWDALRAGALTLKKSRSSPPSSAAPTSRPSGRRS